MSPGNTQWEPSKKWLNCESLVLLVDGPIINICFYLFERLVDIVFSIIFFISVIIFLFLVVLFYSGFSCLKFFSIIIIFTEVLIFTCVFLFCLRINFLCSFRLCSSNISFFNFITQSLALLGVHFNRLIGNCKGCNLANNPTIS